MGVAQADARGRFLWHPNGVVRLVSSPLWRHPDFLKLWAGQGLSLIGYQVTLLALPLTAILVLDAAPSDMGFLRAAGFAPFVLVGLFAGVWIDRSRRRPIVIAADAGRALLLGTIPLAAAWDILRMEQLYLVAFLVGLLAVFGDIAAQAYLPAIVGREQLVEGNSRLQATRSVAQFAGPSFAGALIQLITAPMAILVNTGASALAAICMLLVRTPEPVREQEQLEQNLRQEISEGVRAIVLNPLLRPLAGYMAMVNLFSSVWWVVFVLYLSRDLSLEPGVIGVVLGVGSVGSLLGAVLSGRATHRWGLGRTMVGGALVSGLGGLLIPAAQGPVELVVPLLVCAGAISGAGNVVFNVNQLSLRQAITADRLQGRVGATMRFVVWGTIPLGALLGGVLGEQIGVFPTILVGLLGQALAPLWLFLSPIATLREQPLAPVMPA